MPAPTMTLAAPRIAFLCSEVGSAIWAGQYAAEMT